MALARANNKYRAKLRSTWIASPADTSLLVDAIPTYFPTYVTIGWGTDLETLFLVQGATGDSSANYALTGATRISGANTNLPEQTAVNCLNQAEFFNQYLQTIDWVTDIDAAEIELDLALSTRHRITLGGNRTLTVANPSSGQGFIVRLKQDAVTGSRLVTWFDGISWAYGSEPILTTTPGKADMFVFICTAGGLSPTFDGFVVGQAL